MARQQTNSGGAFLRITVAFLAACALSWPGGTALATAAPTVDVANVAADAEVRIGAGGNDLVSVDWPTGGDSRATATFRLSPDKPLVESLTLRAAADAAPRIVARDLAPFTSITVGTRNLDTPGGWTIFFDTVDQRPHESYAAELKRTTARATAQGSRGSIAFGQLTAGPFSGELVFTFYAGSPLILVEAVVSTPEDRRRWSMRPDWSRRRGPFSVMSGRTSTIPRRPKTPSRP